MKKILLISSLVAASTIPLSVFADTEQQGSLSKTPISSGQLTPQDDALKSQKKESTTSNAKNISLKQKQVNMESHPAVLLKKAVERVSAFVSKGEMKDVASLDHFLDEQIAPFFDFSEMGVLVGGKLYHKMDQANQKEFQQRLQLLMFDNLTSYIVSFDGTMPQTAFFQPVMTPNGQMVARVRVLRRNMRPTNLAFRFVKGSNGWKVIDVAANGQSAILYYRQYYRNYVQELTMRKRLEQQSSSAEVKK